MPIQDQDFSPSAPGLWPDVDPDDWNSATWQLKNRITTLEGLESRIELSEEERAGVLSAATSWRWRSRPIFSI